MRGARGARGACGAGLKQCCELTENYDEDDSDDDGGDITKRWEKSTRRCGMIHTRSSERRDENTAFHCRRMSREAGG